MTETTEPPRRSAGAKRSQASAEAILAAAEAILSEAGPGGFSIEAVARRARAGKPTIYRWWPNRTALLLDVYHRQKRDVDVADTGSLEEDVFLFLRRLFRHWRDTPAGTVFRSIIAEAQSDPAAAEALNAYRQDRVDQLAELFARGRRRGEIEVGPSVAADLMVAFAWSQLLTRGRAFGDDDELRKSARLLAGRWTVA